MAKIAVCSAIMGVICWVLLRFSRFSSYHHFLPQLGVFTALILVATAVYLVLAWAFRCPEIEEVYGIAMRRERLETGPPAMME
jgi:peptidoglycan biosynthesis protein MviN/MurJ (putative lipid II flippase)